MEAAISEPEPLRGVGRILLPRRQRGHRGGFLDRRGRVERKTVLRVSRESGKSVPRARVSSMRAFLSFHFYTSSMLLTCVHNMYPYISLSYVCVCICIFNYTCIYFLSFHDIFFIYTCIYNCLTRKNASEMPHLSYQHCLNSPFISPVERRREEQMEESGEGKDPSRFPFLLSKIIVMPPLHKRKCHKKFRSSCQRFRPHTQRGD